MGAADEDPFPTSCHLSGLTSDGPGPARLAPNSGCPPARLPARDGFVLAKHPAPSMCTTATFEPFVPDPVPLGDLCYPRTSKRLPGPAVDQSPTKVQTIFLTSFPKAKKENQKKEKQMSPRPRSSLDQTETPPPGFLAVRASLVSK